MNVSTSVKHTEYLTTCIHFVATRLSVDFSYPAFYSFLPDMEAYNNQTESPEVLQAALKQYCDSIHPLWYSAALIEYHKRGYDNRNCQYLADAAQRMVGDEVDYQEAINQYDDNYARDLV